MSTLQDCINTIIIKKHTKIKLTYTEKKIYKKCEEVVINQTLYPYRNNGNLMYEPIDKIVCGYISIKQYFVFVLDQEILNNICKYDAIYVMIKN